MQIVTKKVGEPCEVKVIDGLSLDDMQKMVGGFIECFHVGNGVDMWINDMGKIHNMPVNIVIGSDKKEILDTIHGDVFFAANTIDGDTVGLSDEQVEFVKRNLDSGHFAMAHTEHGIEFCPVWIYAPMMT